MKTFHQNVSKYRLTLQVLFFITIIIFIFFLMSTPFNNVYLNIKDGWANVESKLKPEDRNILFLNGEWDFYPEQLVTPDTLADAGDPVPVIVPLALEHKSQPSADALKGCHYGTYHLVLDTGEEDIDYGLYCSNLSCAYTLYINGEYHDGVGKVGNSPETMKAAVASRSYYFAAEDGKVDILIQVSNFQHRNSGLSDNIQLGRQLDIEAYSNGGTYKTSLISGYMFAFVALVFSIFFFYSRAKMFAYFGLASLAIFMRQISISEYLLLYIFPDLKWEVLIRMEYFGLYLAILFFVLYFNEFFPKLIPSPLIKVLIVITTCFCLSVIFCKPIIFTRLLPYYFYIIYAAILLILISLIRYFIICREDRVKILLWGGGFLFLISTVILDIMYYSQFFSGIIKQGNQTPTGFFIFILVNLIIVLQHFYDINKMNTRLAEDLESIVEERTHDLKVATDSAMAARSIAEDAMQAKDQFLANISHEIRTPMNAIMGMSDLLLTEDLTPRQQAYTNDIKVSSAALLDIINDILDFSKMTAGKLNLSPTHYHFPALLDNISSIMRFSADAKSINFMTDFDAGIPPYIFGDATRLRQVLINILGNAIKFTKEGYVKFTVTRLPGDLIEFKIEDTGPGIKQDSLPTIFQPFVQFDYKAHTSSGTGLGLAISKTIVEMMEGKITIESTFGKGSVFYVILPFLIGDKSQIVQTPNFVAFVSAPEAKVLVVDDSEINVNVASGLLQLCDINCDAAYSGPEAIEKAKRADYDLIFMDHMMPGMNGIEASFFIRSLSNKHRNIPIIALTANAMAGAREMFINAGLNDFLSKPIDKALLNQLLIKWLPQKKVALPPDSKGLRMMPITYTKNLQKASKINNLDTTLGLNRVSGMQYVYEKSLKILSRSILSSHDKCLDSLKHSDLKKFNAEVHGMKGSFANVGAMVLSDMARNLEIAAKSGDIEKCKALSPVFLNEVLDLHRELSLIYNDKELSSINLPKGNKQLLKAELDKVYKALDAFDEQAGIDIINKLIQYSYGKETDERLRRLLAMAESFEFEQGMHHIQSMLKELP